MLRINGAAGFLKIWPNMVILPISLGKIHQMNKGKGERLKAEGIDNLLLAIRLKKVRYHEKGSIENIQFRRNVGQTYW